MTRLVFTARCLGDTYKHSRQLARLSTSALSEGLSGVILLLGDRLLQVVEGESSAASAHYQRFLHHPGYAAVALLSATGANVRAWDLWSLRVMPGASHSALDIAQLVRLLSFGCSVDDLEQRARSMQWVSVNLLTDGLHDRHDGAAGGGQVS